MKVRSELKYLRIAPRKVRLVIDLIRRKKVEEAQAILKFAVKKGMEPVAKLLNTAIADAKNNFQLDPANLYISEIKVDGGPILKRWRARSRGMAAPIQKRTSHVTIILDEVVEGKKIKKQEVKEVEKIEKIEKPEIKRPEIKKVDKPKNEAKGLRRIFRRKSI